MGLVGGQVELRVEEPDDKGLDHGAGEVGEGGGQQLEDELAHVRLVGLSRRLRGRVEQGQRDLARLDQDEDLAEQRGVHPEAGLV